MEKKYYYEIWFDGCLLSSSFDCVEFEEEEEAFEEAIEKAETYICEWENGSQIKDFDIRIKRI